QVIQSLEELIEPLLEDSKTLFEAIEKCYPLKQESDYKKEFIQAFKNLAAPQFAKEFLEYSPKDLENILWNYDDYEDIVIIKAIICGANINTELTRGVYWTPISTVAIPIISYKKSLLNYAIEQSNYRLSFALIFLGADPNVKVRRNVGKTLINLDKDTTPLITAVNQLNLSIATLLLENKADPNLDNDFQSPLHYAVDKSHLELVKLLIKYKANCNTKGKRLIAPLNPHTRE
ncbi:unnamed protein product, partial [Didymodactylos carnosus]